MLIEINVAIEILENEYNMPSKSMPFSMSDLKELNMSNGLGKNTGSNAPGVKTPQRTYTTKKTKQKLIILSFPHFKIIQLL